MAISFLLQQQEMDETKMKLKVKSSLSPLETGGFRSCVITRHPGESLQKRRKPELQKYSPGLRVPWPRK